MKTIYSNMDIATMEKRIGDLLKDCDLWADLKLCEDEHRVLTDKIRRFLPKNGRTRSFIRLIKKYPLCCVTQMVFYVVFYYQDEFWAPWAESMDISIDPNKTRLIGQMVNKIIREQGFSYDDNGYTYVTPLTCQAGIPNKYLVDLFNVIEAENQQVFDPFSLVNELLGWKSYLIHKPVMRYINTYRDKAISLFADINEIIHTSSSIVLDAGAYEESLVATYDEWRTDRDENRQKGKKIQQDYPFPTLAFSDDGRGLCLRFPSIISKNDYASSVTWIIILDNNDSMKISCKYHRDSEKLFTKEMLISIVPAESYQIKLYDDINPNKLLKEQRINGLSVEQYLLFDGRGRRILDGFLPNGHGYFILQNNAGVVKFDNINYMHLQLPKRALFCKAWYIAPESERAAITITTTNTKNVLQTRSMLNAELVDADYFLGDDPAECTIPVYTSFPKIILRYADLVHIPDYSITIRHRQTGFKKTANISACLSNDKKLDISVLVVEEGIPYGTYDIRIYEKTSFRKALAFSYVPPVKYCDNALTPWPTKYSNIVKTGFDFVCPDYIQIEVIGDSIQSSYLLNGEEWTSIRVDTPAAVVYGTLTANCGGMTAVIPWSKKVRYLEWSFWNESQFEAEPCFETRIIEDYELKNSKYWLSLWINYKKLDLLPRLELRKKNGNVLQRFDIQKGNLGKWTLPLDSFSTSLENTKLPADLVLCFEENGNERSVVLARIIEAIILPGLCYRYDEKTKNRPALMWKVEHPLPETPVALRGISEPDYDKVLSFEKTVKTKSKRYYGLYLPDELPSGVFKIEAVIEDDFFLEEIGYKPPMLQGQNIFNVNISELNKQLRNLSGILKVLLAVSSKQESVEKLTEIFIKNKARINVDMKESLCKLLVCLICNFAADDDDNSRTIMKLVDAINVNLISEAHRARITKWLLGYSLSSTQMKLCFRRLNLFLFAAADDALIDENDIRKIGDIDAELELLWMLRTHKIKGLCQKLSSLVGLDALKEILIFTPTPNCSNAYWHDCFEKTVSGKCCCAKVSISKGVCGDSNEFREMFDWDSVGSSYKLPPLDLGKRPANGIYFCSQTYIDLLISWYLANSQNGPNPGDLANDVKYLYPQLDLLKTTLIKADRDTAEDFFRKMSGRDIGTKVGFYPLFYYTAIAALGSAFISHKIISSREYIPACRFLIEMMDIFPELVKHDLLLCELIMFFKKR